MYSVNVTIKGVTPLLFNRFLESSIDTNVKKRSGIYQKNNIEDKLYRTPDGKIYTPTTHIIGMLINTGKNFKITGKGKKTYSSLMGSLVDVEPDILIHKNQKWIEYKVSGVIPSTKGRVMISRPMMKDWVLDFNLKFPEDIPIEVMKAMLDYGGQYVGIGDWRPTNKGRFGKFMVTSFKEVTK